MFKEAMKNLIAIIVGIVIAFFVLAFFFPSVANDLVNAITGGGK